MMIKNELREYALSLGVELFGVASAEAFRREFPDKAPPERFVKGACSIVVIGLPYQPSTLSSALRAEELLPFYDDPEGPDGWKPGRKGRKSSLFLTHGGPGATWFLQDEKMLLYVELNRAAYRINTWLRRKGAQAFYFPVNTKDMVSLQAPFELKPAAYMAGLGTLGDNCCILNPVYGPGIQFTSIITDAEMEADGPLDVDVCIHCEKCIKICPVNALKDDRTLDPRACYCCYRCLAVCPVGSNCEQGARGDAMGCAP
jgi:epoxyqueuosine reductase QueG